MAKKWYSIKAKGAGQKKVAQVRIYDEIGPWGKTANQFCEELAAAVVGASKIVVPINSLGGDVFAANAIFNELMRHELPVETRVDGVAASAASLIFMAGDERIMPENATLMVHNAWTIAAGTADDLRDTAEMMDKVREGIVSAYRRSGQSEESVVEMMDATTWMTALDAQALGFCTAIEEPVKLVASANIEDALDRMRDVPAALRTQLLAAANAAAEPELTPPAPQDAATLAAKIYAQSRERGIPQLAEAVLLSGGLGGADAATARLEAAEQIAVLCASVKLQDKATEFVSAGLSVEQVRARLFEHVVTAADSIDISNLQRDQPSHSSSVPERSGPNPQAIYAKRKALSA
ncbi:MULTISPECIES: head maturation protease, ClpP-related [Alcaligenes]|uniref:head maturation protease, ClpP-related n=1 Tax=Alcaligenes TaxID=507 RepID=UPI0003965E9D|nr:MULTISPECIES: head maturation protease, ClpP-related [Alcaligenes]ERI33904.1 peptidase S14 [Alcaligenes sp. EGD-AK7]